MGNRAVSCCHVNIDVLERCLLIPLKTDHQMMGHKVKFLSSFIYISILTLWYKYFFFKNLKTSSTTAVLTTECCNCKLNAVFQAGKGLKLNYIRVRLTQSAQTDPSQQFQSLEVFVS